MSAFAWDQIDAALLRIAKTGPTLAEFIAQSGMADAETIVKDLVYAYVRGGWLVPAPFSPCYELTLAGHAKLAELDQSTAPTQVAKAA